MAPSPPSELTTHDAQSRSRPANVSETTVPGQHNDTIPSVVGHFSFECGIHASPALHGRPSFGCHGPSPAVPRRVGNEALSKYQCLPWLRGHPSTCILAVADRNSPFRLFDLFSPPGPGWRPTGAISALKHSLPNTLNCPYDWLHLIAGDQHTHGRSPILCCPVSLYNLDPQTLRPSDPSHAI